MVSQINDNTGKRDSKSYEILSRSAAHTEALGRALGRLAVPGLYIALCGELGGGKTTFVRGLAQGLEARGHVSSPTFILMREYQGRAPLFHCDFYRMDSQRDMTELELEDCLEKGVVAAEWADKFPPPHSADVLTVTFTWQDENSRTINVSASSTKAAAMADEFIAMIKNI